MQVNFIWRSGLLFAALSLAFAKHKPSSSAKGCYPRGTLSQAVDTLYVKAAWLKTTIPEDRIKNIRLLRKKTKNLFMKNCRFQEQLLSFFMEDVFGQLQVKGCREIHFVEELHGLRQLLSRCECHLNCDCKTRLFSWVCRHVVNSEEKETCAGSLISCASSAREMKTITRMKRTFYGIGNKGIYKAISELDILLSWIKQFLESIK